jgi:hypothetical protein
MNLSFALVISCLLMLGFLALSKKGQVHRRFLYKSLSILFFASTAILTIFQSLANSIDASTLSEEKFRSSRNEVFGREVSLMTKPGKVIVILTDFDEGNRKDFMKIDLPFLKLGLGDKHPVASVVVPTSLTQKGPLGEPIGDVFNYQEFQSMLTASMDCQTVILVGNMPSGSEEAMHEIDFFNPALEEPKTFLALFSASGLSGLDIPIQSGRLKLVSIVRPDYRYDSKDL